jgi:hypothetical protein
MEFQAPQPGHLPIHLGDSVPHSVQANFTFILAIVDSLSSKRYEKTSIEADR